MRCSRCGTEIDHDWQEKGVCIPCLESAERRRRKEAARKGKLRAAGELTGKPTPWPWPWLAHDAQKIISGRKGE